MPGSRLLVPATLLAALLWALVFLPRSAPVAACVPVTLPRGATPSPPAATPTITEAAAQAAVIFRGHPIRQQDVSYKIIDSPATRTTFAVETLWKGAAATEVTVLTYRCGAYANPFDAAGTYIVYASPGLNDELVPLAGISRRAAATDQEDVVLGPGTVPGATAIVPAVGTAAAPGPGATPVSATPAPPVALSGSERRGRAAVLIASGEFVVIGGLLAALLW